MSNTPEEKYAQLFEMLQTASSRLKYPSITLSFHSQKVKLSLATKGYIAIYLGATYSGKITSPSASSVLLYGVTANSPLRDAIETFASYPLREAVILGKKYCHCCFCNRELSNAISLHHGYGPICADTFGLPWSEVSESPLSDTGL